jgi:hypothetical protein
MRQTLLNVCFVSLLSAPANAAQTAPFDPSSLTEAGRAAYLELRGAWAFSIGHIWGRLSSGQRALQLLLKEEKAAEACRGLIRDAGSAGRLYGFLGLRFSDPPAFNEEVERDKSRPPRHPGEGAAEGL